FHLFGFNDPWFTPRVIAGSTRFRVLQSLSSAIRMKSGFFFNRWSVSEGWSLGFASPRRCHRGDGGGVRRHCPKQSAERSLLSISVVVRLFAIGPYTSSSASLGLRVRALSEKSRPSSSKGRRRRQRSLPVGTRRRRQRSSPVGC
ncbi:hypothetical protein Dimus_035985, partial [Dionaea muscipula]